MHTLTSAPAAMLPGFDDPVAGAQAVFRGTLHALSHPGRVVELDAPCGVPAGLSPAMTAVLLTLADGDAPLWLPPGVSGDVARFLRFHTGSRVMGRPGAAVFVAIPAGLEMPGLADLHPGEPAYPDRSATVVLEVQSLRDGFTYELSGPGIQDRQALRVRGLPAGFVAQWQANHQRFPLGVDVLLTCGDLLCGLPRTCRMEA
ncbi:carbon-phosphorus lyase complex subunit [Bordetella ansorpii]|uniref:Carbon-phosphorus lyase complex subunit n=1 Tax=Bordetella ansorpii TaxID=288768 RepID=A0A157SMS6_9BORD|nr:phosphonate C-P lyase system protein PhnH [Bordetella ansorpii]SAI71473.1 carbon-phosphorus lyase complex subunit [Bordetella ansorpii]